MLRKTATQERLGKVAEILGVEIAYVKEASCPFCNGTRPDFGPRQVRWPCQLIKGERYAAVSIGRNPALVYPFEVTEGPYRTGRYAWAIKVMILPNSLVRCGEEELSLSDYSIFPGKEGKWSKLNYIAFLKRGNYGSFECHGVCQFDGFYSNGDYCSCNCNRPPWISEKDWSILQGHSSTK